MTKDQVIQHIKNKALNDIKKIYSRNFKGYDFSNYEDDCVFNLEEQRDTMVRNIIIELEENIENIKIKFNKKHKTNNMKYKFKQKWDEDTDISWWKTSRITLNKIIDSYNNWQIFDNFDIDKSVIILAQIEYGKQTIGSLDGGGGYMEELEDMEQFVNECNMNNKL